MSYLNWKTWALTALLAPTATFAQVCTPRTPDSSCIVIKNADTGAEIATAYDSGVEIPLDKDNYPTRISVAYNSTYIESSFDYGQYNNAQLSCLGEQNTGTPLWVKKINRSFATFDISDCRTAIIIDVNTFKITSNGIINDQPAAARMTNIGSSLKPTPTPTTTATTATPVVTSAPIATPPAPVPAPAPALTYLTFDGYCDEIQFQQIPGSSTFYGTNSPNSCEAGALMFGYVLTGSDNKIHVTLSGGYADAAGNVNALKAVDLELVKADQTDISGNFSAFGVARDAGNRSATQITGQLNGTWKLDTTSRGSKTFATRSAVKPQKSIFSGM